MPGDAYAGHAEYSVGPLRGTDGTNLAPADRGTDFDLAAWFASNPTAAGAAAHANGYPRSDGGAASSGHFGNTR
jgi:hypothetical protein